MSEYRNLKPPSRPERDLRKCRRCGSPPVFGERLSTRGICFDCRLDEKEDAA